MHNNLRHLKTKKNCICLCCGLIYPGNCILLEDEEEEEMREKSFDPFVYNYVYFGIYTPTKEKMYTIKFHELAKKIFLSY